MLDHTVGGGIVSEGTSFQCLVREAAEEASFAEMIIRVGAKACGTVSYVCRTDERSGGELGPLTPEVQLVYGMELPMGLVPRSNDEGVEGFMCMSVEKVEAALKAGEFTPANGCVILICFGKAWTFDV